MADSMSSATERQRHRTRNDLLEAAVRIIIRGDEPTMRSIAAEAQVGERTVYRYFPTLDDVRAAVSTHLRPRAGTPLCSTADELEAYAAELFGTFDANREIILSLLRGEWSQKDLERSRSANLSALHALLRADVPDAAEDAVAAAAGALRSVLSGAGWAYQRISCGLSEDDVVRNAQWMIRAVRAGLRNPEV